MGAMAKLYEQDPTQTASNSSKTKKSSSSQPQLPTVESIYLRKVWIPYGSLIQTVSLG